MTDEEKNLEIAEKAKKHREKALVLMELSGEMQKIQSITAQIISMIMDEIGAAKFSKFSKGRKPTPEEMKEIKELFKEHEVQTREISNEIKEGLIQLIVEIYMENFTIEEIKEIERTFNNFRQKMDRIVPVIDQKAEEFLTEIIKKYMPEEAPGEQNIKPSEKDPESKNEDEEIDLDLDF